MKLRYLLPSLMFCGWFSAPLVALAELESANQYSQTVTRTVLADGLPDQAPGQILELVRYEIPPFSTLPVHTHPGLQIARVEFGFLTYSVIEGVALITRADGTREEWTAGETTVLAPGDAVTEHPDMVHFGKNETPSVVILLSASLLAADQPKAILQEE
ncbi:hypothetical protein NIES970_14850 [[Synechococcus] sp. NIES-970]|uniref:cupin domain-containing protein n=1 Tax=Picosynechococcus sp. NKBG15041c TaxID=1407650 RepID=UPI000404284E|nr:cupin domain-containing protein [Picosynechococcus sp. NKBG15041c]BAW96552.1 hypothetical protein NIES970_14850 [[Synechococcus] sp. NIES-970]